jgi:Eukaryotic aspartyl protease
MISALSTTINILNLSLTFRKYNSVTRMLGILLANKNSNRVISGDGMWQVVASGYTIGGGEFQQVDIEVFPDTGTWLVFLDEDIVDDYYSEVPGATYETDDAGYVFPCTTVLPSLAIRFGAYDAVIPGPYLNACPAIEDDCKWSTVSLSNDSLADLW